MPEPVTNGSSTTGGGGIVVVVSIVVVEGIVVVDVETVVVDAEDDGPLGALETTTPDEAGELTGTGVLALSVTRSSNV